MALFVLGVLIMSSCCSHGESSVPAEGPDPVIADQERAVSIALDKIRASEETPEDFVLIRSELLVGKGRDQWMITFKLSRLLGDGSPNDLAGLGGERFVSVDLATGSAVVRGGD